MRFLGINCLLNVSQYSSKMVSLGSQTQWLVGYGIKGSSVRFIVDDSKAGDITHSAIVSDMTSIDASGASKSEISHDLKSSAIVSGDAHVPGKLEEVSTSGVINDALPAKDKVIKHDSLLDPSGKDIVTDIKYTSRELALMDELDKLKAVMLKDSISVSSASIKTLDIPFDDFSIVTDTRDLIADASHMFDSHVQLKSRRTVADSDLNHFKNKQDALAVRNSTELFLKWKASEMMHSYLVNAVYDVYGNLEPISPVYIQEMSRAMMLNPAIRGAPIHMLNQNGKQAMARSVYGLSHGCLDMAHFAPSEYDSIQMNLNYNSNIGDSNNDSIFTISLIKTNSKGKVDKQVFTASSFSYNVDGNPDLSARLDSNTSFIKSSHHNSVDQLYELSGTKVGVQYSYYGTTERIGINLKDSKKTQLSDGFRTSANTVDGISSMEKDLAFMDLASSLFMIDNVQTSTHEEKRCVVEYIATSIYHHMASNIHKVAGANIVKFELDFTIDRVYSNNDLRAIYIDFVNKGKFVPTTPIQIKHYLCGIDWDSWKEYCAYASICNVRVNKLVQSCMPTTTSVNKFNLREYAINESMLNSSSYNHTSTFSHVLERSVSISYKLFLKELFCRTVMHDPFPDYMLPISAGRWNGSAGSSIEVMPVNMNPVFAKFGMVNKDDAIIYFIKRVTMSDVKFKPPGFCKSSTRMTSSVPNIFNMLLPIADWDSKTDMCTIDECSVGTIDSIINDDKP